MLSVLALYSNPKLELRRTMNKHSTVIIQVARDGRGPATSAHLRNYEAFIDGKVFGYFSDKIAAEHACQIATFGKVL